MSLCRIEVITSLAKFSSLKSALSKAGVRGMTVMQVLGCGVEKGTREYEVDENYEMELLPKQQISVVVKKEQVDKIFIKHPNMPVSLMVTISIRDTMTDTKQEVIGPQIRPPNVMMTSLGSYFRKSTTGIRQAATAI